MITINNINKSFKDQHVLVDVSAQFEKGKVNLIIGQSGSGKSVLAKSMVGLHEVDSGEILFDGNDFTSMERPEKSALRQEIGMLFQGAALFDSLTVEENILIPVWVNKALDAEERLSLVYKVLPELLEMRHRRALLLSGGQQKLAALARALAVGTRLLLLDEPFEGVAPALSKRLADVIAGLKGTEVSVLIAQSDLNHSRKLVDREFVIERGANLEKSQA